ncbi:MAG: GDYXXLXY domain-containing protein [Filomicrobium sp.]
MKRWSMKVWVAALIVAGLQTSALAYMVLNRANLIAEGREIVLDVRPVDPRSLFRGDYVILGYGNISRLDKELLKDIGKRRDSMQVFVTLKKGDEGWQPTSVTKRYPANVAADEVVLNGRLPNRFAHRVTYGIEAFFVPEGEGKELEKLIRAGQLKAIVAVGSDGTAALKGLEVEGERRYDQPLF